MCAAWLARTGSAWSLSALLSSCYPLSDSGRSKGSRILCLGSHCLAQYQHGRRLAARNTGAAWGPPSTAALSVSAVILRVYELEAHTSAHRRSAKQRDELAAVHSITSSAVNKSGGGIVRPSVLAVARLITSSYLVGCWKGRSPAFSPRRTRSTHDAARRYCSTRSVP
jgi:hypothetical protein